MEIPVKELEKRLFDAGNKLLSPPSSTPELLASLNLLENMFAVVEQSPTVSMKEALAPSTKALIAEELLRHTDVDVKVAVASCISEITRITAPEAPYEDEPMKEVFQLIVSSFEKLDDISSRSYLKRISILETVAKVRSCVVMLDLQCDELIVEMFQHFFRTIRDEHQKDVFSSMETIMTLVVDESEDISVDLLSTILNVLKKEGQEVLPIACQLGEKVIVKCASKLKPYLLPAIRSGGAYLDDYCKVVTDVCQTGDEAVEPTNGDAANKITADENNLVDAPSEKAVEVTMEGLEEAPPSEEVGPSSTASPKAIMSNGTLQNDTANSVSANDNFKEADLDMQCEKAESSKAIDDSVGAEEALECKPKQDELSSDNEQKPNSTKSSSETLNPDVSDVKMDDIDKPNNGDDTVLDDIRCEDPVVDTAEAAKDEKLSEVAEDEKLSVEAKDEKSSAVALDEKLSEVVKDEKLSEVAEDDKLTEVVTDEKLSETGKDEKLSEAAKDEKLSEVAKDEKSSEAAKDEKLSEVAKDEKLSEVAKDEKLSEVAKDEKLSEVAQDEKLSEEAKDEKLSEAAKDEKLEKLSEAAKDEKSEKLSEAAKDEKLFEAVKDNKLSEAAKDGKLSEARIPSPKTFGDECADIASVSRNGLADETCSKKTEREEKIDEQMEEIETVRKVEDVEKPGHEDDTILDDTEREDPVVDIAEAVEVEKSSEVPIPSPKTSGSEGAGISPTSLTSVADETCSKKTEQEEKSEERNQERGTVSDVDSEKESDTNNKSDTEDKKETTGSKSKVNTSSDKEASSASEAEESVPDSVGDTKTENDNMDESDDNVAHNLAETEVGESSQEETPKKKSVQAKPTSAKSQKKKSAKGGKKVNTSSDKEASSASEPEESVPDSVGDTKTENDNMDESDDNVAHNLAETEVGESSQEETPKKKSVQSKPTSAKSQKKKSAKGTENDNMDESDDNVAHNLAETEGESSQEETPKKKSVQAKPTSAKSQKKKSAKGGKKKTAAVSKSVSKSTPKSTPKAVKYESDEELLMSNLKRKRSSEGKKTKKVFGAELVGANVKVWWPDDQEFYQGVVESYDSSRKRHKVHYDDGDVEILNLKDERWMFVALSEERENNDDGPDEFADETPKGKKAKTSTDVEAQRGKTANSTKKSGASSSRSKATSKSGSKQETAKTAVKVKEEAPKKGGKSDLEKSGKSTKASKSGSKLLDDTPKSTGKSKHDTTDTPKGSNKLKPDTSKGSSKSKGKTPTTVGKSTSGASGKLKTSAHHDDDNSEDESLESERTPEKPKAKSQSASKSQKSSKKRKRSTKG